MSAEAATADAPQPAPFGQYQLIEKIAQGGMAEIFKGHALDAEGIERSVVIKRILPHIAASPEFVDMLIDEAKIAVMLSHGNIAQVYDLGKVADDYFIVMEYVEGKTLSQIMKRLKTQGKLMPIAYAVYIVREIGAALDYMHRKTDDNGNPLNIIHRDISPQNAILSTAGTVKIIDFGIAKAKTKISTTDSGVLKGKFAYMSPEHAEGMRLDHRTDIFSLGVILYELLTGTRLFKGKNNMETVKRVKKAKVPTPSGIRSAIPKVLDQIVFKALQKNRDKRYQSAHDLVQDLTKFMVSHYPEFSPRELVAYLPTIFPEIAPPERSPHEETPIVPRETEHALKPPGGDWSTKEDTVNADSEVLRQKHREAEVFEVEGTQRTDSSSLEKAGLHEVPGGFRLAKGIKGALAAFGVLVFVGLSWAAVHYGPSLLSRLKETPRREAAHGSPPSTPSSKSATVETPATGREQSHAKASPTRHTASEPVAGPSKTPRSLPPTQGAAASAGHEDSSARFGGVVIESTPPGARIYRNDVDTGHVTPFRLDRVPSGDQRIGLTLDRYRYWEDKVTVAGGKAARIEAKLTLNLGALEINSIPEGAEVILNGKSAGRTPLRLSDLTPDSLYDVTLKREGYETWTGTAKIFGGRTKVINTALEKKPPQGALPDE